VTNEATAAVRTRDQPGTPPIEADQRDGAEVHPRRMKLPQPRTTPRNSAMNGPKSWEFAWAFLYTLASPLLLLFVGFALLTSKVAKALFGHDPAAALVQQHPAAWVTVKLTGSCTLGFLVVSLLLRSAI